MDAFTIAFRINLLRDLFAEGALSTAFVTVFTRAAAAQDERAAWRLANKVTTLTVVTLSVITVLGILSAPWLVAALAPGFDPEKAQLTVTLTRVMYPFILLVSLAALVMGTLNARNVFGMPAMASSFFNLGSIIAGVLLGYWLDPHFGPRAILGLAIGTLVGGAAAAGAAAGTAPPGLPLPAGLCLARPGREALLRLMGPSVIAASTTQVNVLINSVFASQLGDGPHLLADRGLPPHAVGISGVALGTVARRSLRKAAWFPAAAMRASSGSATVPRATPNTPSGSCMSRNATVSQKVGPSPSCEANTEFTSTFTWVVLRGDDRRPHQAQDGAHPRVAPAKVRAKCMTLAAQCRQLHQQLQRATDQRADRQPEYRVAARSADRASSRAPRRRRSSRD